MNLEINKQALIFQWDLTSIRKPFLLYLTFLAHVYQCSPFFIKTASKNNRHGVIVTMTTWFVYSVQNRSQPQAWFYNGTEYKL